MAAKKLNPQEQDGEPLSRKEIHAALKKIVADEVAALPETIKAMQPKERARFLLELLPYVSPKMEAVSANYGEGMSWDC